MKSPEARVFLSFDLAHDRDLHTRLRAESKAGSLFSITACSEDPGADTESDERVRERIAAADAVIVICGEHTDACASVSAELRMAREQQKPHFLLWGRREIMCKKPASAKLDDSMYGWTPDILRAQLQVVMRAKREAPEHLRRKPIPPKPAA